MAREKRHPGYSYDWLTENGNLVILNNGIEFSAPHFIMLLGCSSLVVGDTLVQATGSHANLAMI